MTDGIQEGELMCRK